MTSGLVTSRQGAAALAGSSVVSQPIAVQTETETKLMLSKLCVKFAPVKLYTTYLKRYLSNGRAIGVVVVCVDVSPQTFGYSTGTITV